MKTLDQFVRRKDWKSIIRYFTPQEVVDFYSYEQSMHLLGYLMIAATDEICIDEALADSIRRVSVDLMIEIRSKFSKEWEKDWKNEAFLGISGCN